MKKSATAEAKLAHLLRVCDELLLDLESSPEIHDFSQCRAFGDRGGGDIEAPCMYATFRKEVEALR